MITATRRWFRRNRTNLFIGAGVIGAGYLAGQYALSKLQEARQRMREEQVGKENLKRRFEQNQEDCTYTVLALLPSIRDEIVGALPVEQITEQLQQDRQDRLRRLGASEAASSELPSAPPSVTDRDDTASLHSGSFIHASQVAGEAGTNSNKPKRSKAQLWQEMKINSIARALTLLYSLSLLTLFTRIQLNLLGRRTYLSSVVALASPPEATQTPSISLENRDDDNYDDVYENDFETNRMYLTFSWWLLHRGSKQVLEKVMVAVKDVFGAVNIREDLAIERLGSLIMEVRKRVEGSTIEERRRIDWLQCLLPPLDKEGFVLRQSSMSETGSSPGESDEDHGGENPYVGHSLRRLLDETSDLIESPTFSHVLTQTLDASFSRLIDYKIATEAYKFPVQSYGRFEDSSQGPKITEIPDTRCKLANILPVFCKEAHVIAVGSGEMDALAGVAAQENLGNEYLAAVDQVRDLEAFAAVIYSSNFESETQEQASQSVRQEIPSNIRIDTTAGEALLSPTIEDVPETEPREAAESILGQSGIVVPTMTGTESPITVPSTADFESAWTKATSDKDAPPH